MDKLEQAVERIVVEFRDSGPTDAEVTAAKQRMSASTVYARDSYSTAAHVIGEALATGQTLADVEAWPERIAAVTRDEVAAAARLVLGGPTVTSLLMAPPDSEAAAAQGSRPGTPEPASSPSTIR